MCSLTNAIKKVVDNAEYMSQRKHGYDTVTRLNGTHLITVIYIGADTAVGEHDTFGIACSSGGIVDDGQLFRRFFFAVTDMFWTEILRIALPLDGITVIKSFC